MRLHLDTDLAGDPDDACALAMVLGWPGAELVGITTTADPDGRRADYVAHLLRILGRMDIPVAAGAGTSTTTGETMGEIPDHDRYWAAPVTRRASGGPSYVELLARSIAMGATVVAIGPYTNLAVLEKQRPGSLAPARVVTMGGWVYPPVPPLPHWGPGRDWNVQCDTVAATTLLESCRDLTVVPLPATIPATLRERDLPRLVDSGPVGALLARQSTAHRDDNGYVELGRSEPALPDDLVNFHWDPVACAVALGWDGVSLREVEVAPVLEGGALRFEPSPHGLRTQVVVDVDGAAFAEVWIAAVEDAQDRVSGAST